MSEEMWKKYDEISIEADIIIKQNREGKFVVVDNGNKKYIAGPFESAEEAAINVIEGGKDGRGSEEKAYGRNRVAVY